MPEVGPAWSSSRLAPGSSTRLTVPGVYGGGSHGVNVRRSVEIEIRAADAGKTLPILLDPEELAAALRRLAEHDE